MNDLGLIPSSVLKTFGVQDKEVRKGNVRWKSKYCWEMECRIEREKEDSEDADTGSDEVQVVAVTETQSK
jgi:hypothetical protein